ncbi:MAG: urease subunit gamma [Nitrososphaera sp.]|jgi:urease gamma subunit
MIHVRAIIKGEPDVPPLLRTMSFENGSDEEIFFRSAIAVKEKLDRGLKLNVNESILLYCSYAVNGLRASIAPAEIERQARVILSHESVLIGVPESLQQLLIEAAVDGEAPVRLKIDSPIRLSNASSDFQPLV